MKILNKTSIASVALAEVEVSLDELKVYQTALSLALTTLSEPEIKRLFGATKDELEGITEDVESAISACSQRQMEPAFA